VRSRLFLGPLVLASLSCAGLAAAGDGGPRLTVFDHPDDTPFWVSGQLNVIFQAHPSFTSPYEGPHSFSPREEARTSFVVTLYTGIQLTPTTELLVDVESAGGSGLSTALGLAGFTNLDVVRNPELGATPYLARLEIRQIFPLSEETVEVSRGPFGLATRVPARRLELRVGRFGTVDFFDLNAVASDSHLQFMNWTVDNNGAYDYAADTRGYSWGLVLEYQSPAWGLRLGEMLMPTVANGISFDTDVWNARGENLEGEARYRIAGQPGTVRLLAYLNHANMGSYREAIDAFLAGADPAPDVTKHRHVGTLKYGFGLNVEQAVGSAVRLALRAGWNEGKNELFAYTEVNDTLQLAADLRGEAWHRPVDKIGLALVSNGISKDHRDYLALGGLGFLLGDGRLTYGREQIVEAYYTAFLGWGVSLAADVQFVKNPGYNVDRGPVWVGSLRMHVEL
jgi:high affinity Mn2+ porin